MVTAMKIYNQGFVPTPRIAALAAVFLLTSATLLPRIAAANADPHGSSNTHNAAPAANDPTGAAIDSVRRQLKEEEERIRALEQRLAADETGREAARAAAAQLSPPAAKAPASPGNAAPVSPQYAAPAGAAAVATSFGSS